MRFLLSHQAHTDFPFENSSPLLYHSRYIYTYRILHGFFDHSPRKSFNFWNAQLIPWITTLVIGFYIGAALGAGVAGSCPGRSGSYRTKLPAQLVYIAMYSKYWDSQMQFFFKTKFPPNLIVCHDSPC